MAQAKPIHIASWLPGLLLACGTVAALWSGACIRHVTNPEGQTITQAAREAADRFVAENEKQTGKDWVGRFLSMEDRGDEIWVVYARVVPPDVSIDHDTVRVACNKKTGATRWVMW